MSALEAQLAEIIPGKTYPSSVSITEKGEKLPIRFLMQSYFVGTYCAIYFPGHSIPQQTGDHNNRTFVGKLKKDIIKAIARGAEVEISRILPVKKDMS